MNAKNLFLNFILLAILPFSGFAAYTGLSSEIVAVDAISGYVTWRIYAEFDDPADQMVALYGYDTAPMHFNTAGDFYQNPLGGSTSLNINPGTFVLDPDLEYDSWITVGYQDQIGSAMQVLGFDFTDFEAGNNWLTNDVVGGSVFNFPGDPFSSPVAGRVLFAQLTTSGDMDLSVNIQWRDASSVSHEEVAQSLIVVNGGPG